MELVVNGGTKDVLMDESGAVEEVEEEVSLHSGREMKSPSRAKHL